MTMARYSGVVTDQAGNIITNAKIEVRREVPGAPLAALKSDRDGLVGISNPFNANADGTFSFHAIGGAYKVRAYVGPSGAPTFEDIRRYTPVGLLQEYDLDAILIGKRQQVRVATTANITISTALNNGDTLDGVTLATNDLVLVKNQTSKQQNGIYVVGVTPARAAAFSTYDAHAGAMIAVVEGTANASTAWFCTANAGGILDTTAIDFTKVAAIAGPPGADGEPGPPGPATIAIGTVTTLAPGEDATVTNSGDDENVVLDFGIPQGDDGNVTGPASAVDGTPAVFDGTTGGLLKNISFAAFKALLSLDKSDVGLGNADNTSDATKNSASATLTNKILTDPLVSRIIGGTGTGSSLDLQSTSGAGATDYIRARVGNNGAIEAWRTTSAGNTGFGTTTPSSKVVINGNTTQAQPTPGAGTVFHFMGADGGTAGMQSDGFGGSGTWYVRRANNTAASPSGITSGQTIFQFVANAYHSGGAYTSTNPAVIQIMASETWSLTANGSKIVFGTTPNGSATRAAALVAQNSGGISVGVDSDPGAGLIKINSASFLMVNNVSWNNGAAAATGTLTNAPSAGNPTKWIPINDNGTTRYIPAW